MDLTLAVEFGFRMAEKAHTGQLLYSRRREKQPKFEDIKHLAAFRGL